MPDPLAHVFSIFEKPQGGDFRPPLYTNRVKAKNCYLKLFKYDLMAFAIKLEYSYSK